MSLSSGVKKIDNPDDFRNEIRKRLNTIVHDDKKTVNLEKAVFNYAIKKANKNNIVKKWDNEFFISLYIDHLRTIYTNLKDPVIRDKIKNNEIKAQDLPFMSHQEMRPDKWKDLIEAKKIRDKNMYEPNIEASTDNFTCRKCKSKKCTYYQLQTRSADEPMTTFVTCIDCGNRWKC